MQKKSESLNNNTLFHPRNKHQGNYDFKKLIQSLPELSPFVKTNEHNIITINFFDPLAVKTLNTSLLKQFYNIDWKIPDSFLSPPIPGRSDYIHYAADLLAHYNHNVIPTGIKIKIFDIGVGANCIYPIIGIMEYGWNFTGVDIDKEALNHATKIVNANSSIQNKIKLKHQTHPEYLFKTIVKSTDKFDLSICNPPFHATLKEARETAIRKLKNLGKKDDLQLNFSGNNNELFCKGGEFGFVKRMIIESKEFSNQFFWFTCLISKKENLKPLYNELKKVEVLDFKTIDMKQGNKTSRFIAWTFLNPEQQKAWAEERFKNNT